MKKFTSGLFAALGIAGLCLAHSPLIIVPGLEASVLEAKWDRPDAGFGCSKSSDWQVVWLNYGQLLPWNVKCWADNLKLKYDPSTDVYENTPGVEVRVKGEFGSLDAIRELAPDSSLSKAPYFKDLIDYLVSNGYQEGKDIFGAGYDFRRAPTKQYLANFKNLVETAYSLNNGTKVSIVSHSMGSIYTWIFTNSVDFAWNQKYIANWISVAGALGGTALETKGFATGNPPIPQLDFYSGIFKDLERSEESNLLLFPDPIIFKDKVVVSTPERSYTASELEDFIADVGAGLYLPAYKRIVKTLTNLKPPRVPLHCIYASGVDTADSIEYPEGFDKAPTILNAPGDGSLTLESVKKCEAIANQQSDIRSSTYTIEGSEHGAVVKDKRFLEKVLEILTEESPI